MYEFNKKFWDEKQKEIFAFCSFTLTISFVIISLYNIYVVPNLKVILMFFGMEGLVTNLLLIKIVLLIIIVIFIVIITVKYISNCFVSYFDKDYKYKDIMFLENHFKAYNIITTNELLKIEENAKKENINEIWIITSNLQMEIADSLLTSIIKKNSFLGKVKYTFFVPYSVDENNTNLKDFKKKYNTSKNSNINVVIISKLFKNYLFRDFDVVIHNPQTNNTNDSDNSCTIRGFICIAPDQSFDENVYRVMNENDTISFRDILLEAFNEKISR